MTQFVEQPQPNAVHEAQASQGLRLRILLSPYNLAHNTYIEIQKALFRDLGYDVQPLSVKNLMSGAFFHLFRSKTIVVFHWLELRAFRRKGAQVMLSPSGCALFAFYCLLMCLGRAKVVYFVHDHAVHDSAGRMRHVSMKLIGLIRRLSDFRVVHAPNFEDQYDAQFLPHPIYWDVPGHRMAARGSENAKPVFTLLGEVRPYKKIDAVLDVWPAQSRLLIAGKGSEEYVGKLRAIVARRMLADAVQIEARFLSDEEFEARISATDVMILPHAAESMLVSGAFFQAIGRVPVVISRATPFMTWAATKFDNVLLFDDIAQLPALVEKVEREWPTRAKTGGPDGARDAFGWAACRRQYQRFFERVAGVDD